MSKNKYVKVLIICVAVLIGLTAVSRATDSVTVAKVNAEIVKRGSLVQKTMVNGEIDASKKHYVRSSTSLRVEEIFVGQGSYVAAGDILLSLDCGNLADEAEKMRVELSNTRLEIQKMRMESGSSSAISSAQAELDRALADDEFNRGINDGMQMQADRRKIEDATSKLEDARKNSTKNNIDIEIRENNLKLKQKEYDDIRKVLIDEGKVAADIDGTIGEIFAVQGETLKGENYCTIIPEGANFIFSGEIKTDDAQYMKTGDPATITLAGVSRPLSNLTVKSIAREEGVARVICDIPAGTDAYIAQKATLTHEQKSEEYRSTVPLGAVRGSEDDYYVYIVSETSGVLGVQKTASKMEVTVTEKDNKNAAIEGGFTQDDLIITRSNKAITEGDRVRVQSADIGT
ncbi:MAG: efflux RND transporter periplasmic adaptor subunit [Clostridiales bacterium]|nr:efflux RND transporter periplasmic adaptor subunit [Clostridiales bacterium]